MKTTGDNSIQASRGGIGMMTNGPAMVGNSRGIDLPVGLGITMIAALGIAVGALSRRRSTRGRQSETANSSALVAYLREHLSGADTAIQVVDHLRRAEAGAAERQLFSSLYEQLRSDRHVVEVLLASLGASSRSAKRVAGQVSGSLLKLMAGGARGELSLFRTLEALSVGIQGKRCMWRALQALYPNFVTSSGRSFAELEAAAIRQWEAVEQRRRSLVPVTLAARGSSVTEPILQPAGRRSATNNLKLARQ